jgi:hypothetical protein
MKSRTFDARVTTAPTSQRKPGFGSRRPARSHEISRGVPRHSVGEHHLLVLTSVDGSSTLEGFTLYLQELSRSKQKLA